ncbi:MAG: permease [Planctomycetota bacterium]|nr:permease [Planctomycetota bacterium]
MTWKRELPLLLLAAGVFAACCLLPVESMALAGPSAQSMLLVRDYARHHVPLGLVPGLFIGGAVAALFNRRAVLTCLGPAAPRPLAYGVASVGGGVLSVCSCSVLPLFAGIRRAGAGLGPACAFLYAAPAINVLAIVLTARVLGAGMSLARAGGAVVFSVAIGLGMAALFRRGEAARGGVETPAPGGEGKRRPWGKVAGVLAAAVAALVFLNVSPAGFSGLIRCCDGGKSESAFTALSVQREGDTLTYQEASGSYATVPASRVSGLQPRHESRLAAAVYDNRFALAGLAGACMLAMLLAWFGRADVATWLAATWSLAKSILPLLLVGVAATGFLLGRPGHPGAIPTEWIASALQGNGVGANLAAAAAAALMCLATLTEVPIVSGLLAAGMGKGPALAMLLAGPSVSLPAALVLCSVLGVRKTLAYVLLVVLMAAASGWAYGAL